MASDEARERALTDYLDSFSTLPVDEWPLELEEHTFRAGWDARERQARADRERLAAAVRAWDATLSEYCDGPERDAVRAALAAQPGAPGAGE